MTEAIRVARSKNTPNTYYREGNWWERGVTLSRHKFKVAVTIDALRLMGFNDDAVNLEIEGGYSYYGMTPPQIIRAMLGERYR